MTKRFRRGLHLATPGVVFFLCAGSVLGGPQRGAETAVVEQVLENGFKLILAPRPAGGMVSALTYHGEGSVHDPPGLSGLAHFFEHLVFEGTPRLGTWNWTEEKKILDELWELEARIEAEKNRRAQEQPHRNVAELADHAFPLDTALHSGGLNLAGLEERRRELLERRLAYNRPLDVNNSLYYWGDVVSFAATGVDATMYESFLPARHLEALFWIESDKFQPVFRNFYAARDTVQEQVLRWQIDPETEFNRNLNQLFFASTFGRYSGGGYELEQASPLDAREFQRKYLTPNNSHLVLVGEVDAEEARRLAVRYFGPLERGAPPPRVRVLESEPQGEKRLHAEGGGRPQVEIRFPIPPGESEANPALDLLVEILNGPSGRLARRLLGPEGIAVSATAARRTTRRWGYFSIRTYPRSNDLLGRAEQSILQELERLGENLVSAEEFERARLKLWARHQATLADTQALARALGEQEVLSGWRDFLQRPDRWSAVTPEALRSLAAATFHPSRRTLGVYRRKEVGR